MTAGRMAKTKAKTEEMVDAAPRSTEGKKPQVDVEKVKADVEATKAIAGQVRAGGCGAISLQWSVKARLLCCWYTKGRCSMRDRLCGRGYCTCVAARIAWRQGP